MQLLAVDENVLTCAHMCKHVSTCNTCILDHLPDLYRYTKTVSPSCPPDPPDLPRVQCTICCTLCSTLCYIVYTMLHTMQYTLLYSVHYAAHYAVHYVCCTLCSIMYNVPVKLSLGSFTTQGAASNFRMIATVNNTFEVVFNRFQNLRKISMTRNNK